MFFVLFWCFSLLNIVNQIDINSPGILYIIAIFPEGIYRRQSGKMGLNWKPSGESEIIFILYGL